MELPQAIEELKVEYLGDSFAVVEAKKIAVDAIEKQIPKPVLVTKKTCRFFCPCCYGDDEAIRYDYCAHMITVRNADKDLIGERGSL